MDIEGFLHGECLKSVGCDGTESVKPHSIGTALRRSTTEDYPEIRERDQSADRSAARQLGVSRISIMKTQWSHTSGSREPSAGQREVEIWISVRANIHLSHCAYSPVQVGRYMASPDYEHLPSSVVRHRCHTALGVVHVSDATIERC